MTRRISAVAVCRSSASLVSLNRRTFSIAITAWSAKVRSSSIWCGVNWPGSRRVTLSMPIETSSRRSGVITMLRKPRARATMRASCADWEWVLGVGDEHGLSGGEAVRELEAIERGS